jgi:hypothetical protein
VNIDVKKDVDSGEYLVTFQHLDFELDGSGETLPEALKDLAYQLEGQ